MSKHNLRDQFIQPGLGAVITWGGIVPTAASVGYPKGCLFIDMAYDPSHTTGVPGIYVNEGTVTSCNFESVATLTGTTLDSPIIKTAILDDHSKSLIRLSHAASAVNAITIQNAATGNSPYIQAYSDGTDAAVAITLAQYGAKPVILGAANCTGIQLYDAATQLILDQHGEELLAFTHVNSAKNWVNIANAGTGVGPTIAADGETDVALYLNQKGAANVIIGTTGCAGIRLGVTQPILDEHGKTILEFAHTNSAVNWPKLTNTATGVGPIIESAGDGTDANVALNVRSKGTGAINLKTGGATNNGFIVVDTASAVNGVQVTPAATGVAGPVVGAVGETNAGITLKSAGTGAVNLQTGGATSAGLTVINTASAVDFVQITPGSTGDPGLVVIDGTGSDTNVSLTVRGKGTGVVTIGQATGAVKIGTAATDYVGFFDATAVVRQNHIADAITAHDVTGSDQVDQSNLQSALNSLGTTINSILTILETFGFVKTS